MTTLRTYPPHKAPEGSRSVSEMGDINSPAETVWVDKRGHKGKERRCIASGASKDTADMIRFVLSPDGIAVPDIAQKLPGRGVWCTATREDIQMARKNGGFARGFKSKTSVPDDMDELIEKLLVRRILGLIAMAKKSGRIFIGFDQVKAAAGQGDIAWRIEASDGAQDGRGKIRTLSKAVAKELERPVPKVLGCFSSEQLANAIGRDTAIHLALPHGPMAKAFKQEAKILSGFRALIPANWPDLAHE